MRVISKYKKIKSLFYSEILTAIIFFIALSFHAKEMGVDIYIVGLLLIFFLFFLTFIRNYYYRIFCVLNGDYYIKPVISINNKIQKIKLVSVKKNFLFDLYKVELQIESNNRIKKFYTSLKNEEEIPPLSEE